MLIHNCITYAGKVKAGGWVTGGSMFKTRFRTMFKIILATIITIVII